MPPTTWAHASAATLMRLPPRWPRSTLPPMRSRMSPLNRIPRRRICSLSSAVRAAHGQSVLHAPIDREQDCRLAAARSADGGDALGLGPAGSTRAVGINLIEDAAQAVARRRLIGALCQEV